MSQLVEQLPAGAFTLSGKSEGPAVALGRNRYAKSQLMFMGAQELRDALAAFGWANDVVHAQLVKEHEELQAAHQDAKDYIADLEEKVDTLEKAIGYKPADPPARPPAARQSARSAK